MFKIIFFLLLILIQFAIPLGMIYKHNKILKHGERYNLLTKPYDPIDPFLGNYISFEVDSPTVTTNTLHRGQKVYLQLVATNNFYVLGQIETIKPKVPHITAKVSYQNSYYNQKENTPHKYPTGLIFDGLTRVYFPNSYGNLNPELQSYQRRQIMENLPPITIQFACLDGDIASTELQIDGKPAIKILLEEREKNKKETMKKITRPKVESQKTTEVKTTTPRQSTGKPFEVVSETVELPEKLSTETDKEIMAVGLDAETESEEKTEEEIAAEDDADEWIIH